MKQINSGTFEYFLFLEKKNRPLFNRLYEERGWQLLERSDGKEYDAIIGKGRFTLKVEEKYRPKIWDDILVELVQDIETDSPGWLYYTKVDILLYMMANRVYVLNTQKLRKYIRENLAYLNTSISKKGWGTTKFAVLPIYLLRINNLGYRVK